MQLEYKAIPSEFKAGVDDGSYEGYFSVFGNVDDGGDVMHEGAFAKTLSERAKRVKVLMYHDWSRLIGPAPDVLKEDSKGLYAKGKLAINTFYGRESFELMKAGALSEGSIGYMTVKADYGTVDAVSIRHLREVALYEISMVPLGMNPLTDIALAKSLLESTDPAEREEGFERYMHLVVRMHGQTKAGRVLSASNLTLAKNALGAAEELAEMLKKLIAAAEPADGKSFHSALQRRARAIALRYRVQEN